MAVAAVKRLTYCNSSTSLNLSVFILSVIVTCFYVYAV